MNSALLHDEQLKQLKIEIKEYEALLEISGGDARKLLNLLELVVQAYADKRRLF